MVAPIFLVSSLMAPSVSRDVPQSLAPLTSFAMNPVGSISETAMQAAAAEYARTTGDYGPLIGVLNAQGESRSALGDFGDSVRNTLADLLPSSIGDLIRPGNRVAPEGSNTIYEVDPFYANPLEQFRATELYGDRTNPVTMDQTYPQNAVDYSASGSQPTFSYDIPDQPSSSESSLIDAIRQIMENSNYSPDPMASEYSAPTISETQSDGGSQPYEGGGSGFKNGGRVVVHHDTNDMRLELARMMAKNRG